MNKHDKCRDSAAEKTFMLGNNSKNNKQHIQNAGIIDLIVRYTIHPIEHHGTCIACISSLAGQRVKKFRLILLEP